MSFDNMVELIGTYGGDETHALSAWTSTSRELTEEKRGRMGKLLMMLGQENHGSVFEKSSLHFLVTTEIPTHYQILKHRIGVSCVSGDTEISISNASGSIEMRKISALYDAHTNGITTHSSSDKEYRRLYGRKVPVRTKENASDLITRSHIANVFHNGKKPLFKITTDSGKSIKTTLDHRFLSVDREWVEIGQLLKVELINDRATFANDDCFVATNGIKLNVPNKPWTFVSFFTPYENKSTRMQMATATNLDYNLIKKWGYIHNITFAIDPNKDYKKGRKLSIDFEKIISIEYVGVDDVFDLEIDDTHNYIANGFVVHNCNAESARYKELKDDKFYIPSDWDNDEQALLIKHCQESIERYHQCLARLIEKGMPRKRAKESARFYLPYANQLTADVMFNFRSFMHFIGLRNSENAQLEIRNIAATMLKLVSETKHFDMSLDAFGWTKDKIQNY